MFDKIIYLTGSACSIGKTVGFSIFTIDIRWYAFAYILGLILGQIYIKILLKTKLQNNKISPQNIEKFLLWAMLGILLGGRIGYVLFYNLDFYLSYPTKIFYLWQGGMSFHGGLIGILLAMIIFCKKYKIPFLSFTDLICAAAPIGIFLGRITNFLNGELWGRPSNLPWAINFKCAGDITRHPSQLYEAFLEGIIIFTIIYFLINKLKLLNYPGRITGLFCFLYALFRIIIEFFREPDAQIGFIMFNFTMGIILSLPLLLIGMFLLIKNK